MNVLFLVCFIAGLLLAVRLMFFGAERRTVTPDSTPLRRSEPAIVALLLGFGIAGYLFHTRSGYGTAAVLMLALVIAVASAALLTRLAVVTASLVPEHDPEDPRYRLQGVVGHLLSCIPADGEGRVSFPDGSATRELLAREIESRAIEAGEEVCIERIDGDVAWVERWASVEARL